MRIRALLVVLSFATTTQAPAADAPPARTISGELFHLGDSDKPDWAGLTTVEPVREKRLELAFDAHPNDRTLWLEVQAGGVDGDWKVEVNGRELGELEDEDDLEVQHFRVPPDTLEEGENRLRILAEDGGDDIYVGRFVLHYRPLHEVLGHGRLRVRVTDAATGKPLPCRLTVTRLELEDEGKADVSEELAELTAEGGGTVAVREGVVYTASGEADVFLEPGRYAVYATRGLEYGLGSAFVDVSREEDTPVDLTLRREVDTTGFLAADTHIHTRTYSGHGDIDVPERIAAILGEGVEVAVATDHNHHTDYRPAVRDAGLEGTFLPVTGNEVTTSFGHFNAFPAAPDAEPPEHDHESWTDLMAAIRATPGVRVIVLNHPRRSRGEGFDRLGLNPLSGEPHRGPSEVGVDCVEVLNGKTLHDDHMLTVDDWFALLNRGVRMTAVAASDSHAVDEIVGQARSYVASSTDDPAGIRIEEVCRSFREGRVLASLGLLARVEVEGKFESGDLASGLGETIDVSIEVSGPSWTRASEVVLYLNGVEVRRQAVEPTARSVKLAETWTIPSPSHDAHLVVVATGPPVKAPYWPIDDGDGEYLMGLTNPVWIDGDGDGRFTPAAEYARVLADLYGVGGKDVGDALARFDNAVAVQFASLVRSRIQARLQESYERLLEEAETDLATFLGTGSDDLRKTFEEYLSTAPRIGVRQPDED